MSVRWGKYRKFIVAALTAAAVAAQAAYTDGTITTAEWWTIGFAALGALLVRQVRNDQPPRHGLAANVERIRQEDRPFETP